MVVGEGIVTVVVGVPPLALVCDTHSTDCGRPVVLAGACLQQRLAWSGASAVGTAR